MLTTSFISDLQKNKQDVLRWDKATAIIMYTQMQLQIQLSELLVQVTHDMLQKNEKNEKYAKVCKHVQNQTKVCKSVQE